jgi:hypothetical protein
VHGRAALVGAARQRIPPMKMFEVRVVRKRQGRERKHKVWSYMVVAGSEHEASALMRGWTRYDVIVRVTAVTPVMVKGQVDSLTDGELRLAHIEGYGAVWAERDAKREAERKAQAGIKAWEAEKAEAERIEAEDAELAGLVVA